jgi:pyridoxal phosphate enzyme (YggS family)
VIERFNRIRGRIRQAAERAGRDPATVRLVAVSKTKPVEMMREAVAAGAAVFGENYIQEAREKHAALADLGLEWHFIGHLQSNKAKYAVKLFDLIHSVDTVKLAREIDRQAAKIGRIQPILLQVNISREPTKSGIDPQDLPALAADVARLPNLSVKGLMTMPPFFDDPDRARPFFRSLHRLSLDVLDLSIPNISMAELSMGMTGDFEAAVEEGATLVRIGTALFGPRG